MKKLLSIFSLFIAMCALSACQSTPPQWSAVGGSRADGVIRLAYEQGEFNSQIPSSQQASQIATSRCKAWGYHAASPFGGKAENVSPLAAYFHNAPFGKSAQNINAPPPPITIAATVFHAHNPPPKPL